MKENKFMALMYHSLAEEGTDTYTVSFSEFEKQLAYLHAEGYVIEGFDGLEHRLATSSFPERYIVLTFDDGHVSNLEASRRLSAIGANATFLLQKIFVESGLNLCLMMIYISCHKNMTVGKI